MFCFNWFCTLARKYQTPIYVFRTPEKYLKELNDSIDNPQNTPSQKIAFYHCGVSFRIANAFEQFLDWTAAVFVALKYYLTTEQIKAITLGNLTATRTKKILYISFGIFWSFSLVILIAYLITTGLIHSATKLDKVSFVNIIINTIFVAILTILLLKSLYDLRKALNKTSGQQEMNLWMLVINIVLFIIYFCIQIFYIKIFEAINAGGFVVSILHITLGLILKSLFMFLA